MTPLVLFHGFTGSPQSWDAVQGSLEATAIRPTLLGHEPFVAGQESFVARDERDANTRMATRSSASRPSCRPKRPSIWPVTRLAHRLALSLSLAHPERVARA